MPSAEAKVEKQMSADSADAANSTPLRQAITIIEHKIRNLEKRKTKLESYKQLQNSGKDLNGDQKTALDKIGEVVQTLEFAKDLYKQFLGIEVSSEKEAKKQAKREAAAKKQQELARLREILLVQDALNQMGNETVRDDFLHGRNGAAQLSENDLKLLDDIYPAVTPKHEAGNPTVFTNEVQAAAEHLLAVVDGKPKEIFNGSYSQVKEILGKIHESGYFDQDVVKVYEADAEDEAAEQADLPYTDPSVAPPDYSVETAALQDPTQPILDAVAPEPPLVAAPAAALDAKLADGLVHVQPMAGAAPPPPQQQLLGQPLPLNGQPQALQAQPMPLNGQQVLQQAQMPLNGQPTQPVALNGGRPLLPQQAMLPPEQAYYAPGAHPAAAAAAPPMAAPQQPPVKHLFEMIESNANFSFLQESEIDKPEPIPTQMYTNQSFVSALR